MLRIIQHWGWESRVSIEFWFVKSLSVASDHWTFHWMSRKHFIFEYFLLRLTAISVNAVLSLDYHSSILAEMLLIWHLSCHWLVNWGQFYTALIRQLEHLCIFLGKYAGMTATRKNSSRISGKIYCIFQSGRPAWLWLPYPSLHGHVQVHREAQVDECFHVELLLEHVGERDEIVRDPTMNLEPLKVYLHCLVFVHNSESCSARRGWTLWWQRTPSHSNGTGSWLRPPRWSPRWSRDSCTDSPSWGRYRKPAPSLPSSSAAWTYTLPKGYSWPTPRAWRHRPRPGSWSRSCWSPPPCSSKTTWDPGASSWTCQGAAILTHASGFDNLHSRFCTLYRDEDTRQRFWLILLLTTMRILMILTLVHLWRSTMIFLTYQKGLETV